MKKFSEQFHKRSLAVKMTVAEKRELKERLTSYMEYHPFPVQEMKRATKPTRTKTESFVTVPFSYFARIGVATAVFLLILVPAMAERAVPGDGLYAIKVRFNEELRSTLAFTPHEKIEWETERLNRRIAEARLLASEGRLTEEVETEVAAAVRAHTESAKREIAVLRDQDQEEADLATIELSATLGVQADSLKERPESSSAVATQMNNEETPVPVNGILATAVEEAEQAVESNGAAAGIPSFDRLMGRVESNTTRMYELLRTLDLSENSQDYQDINRRIDDISRTVADAVAIREEDEEAARLDLVDALERTQRVIVFMSEIRASQEHQVNDFVPVVLTPDEERERFNVINSQTNDFVLTIESRMASSTNDFAVERAQVVLEQIAVANSQIASTTDITEAESIFTTISALVNDVMKALDEEPDVTSEASTVASSTTTIATSTTTASTSGDEQTAD